MIDHAEQQPAAERPPNPTTTPQAGDPAGVHVHDMDEKRFCRICSVSEQDLFSSVNAANPGSIPATTDTIGGAHLIPAPRAVRLLLIPHIMRIQAAAAAAPEPSPQDGVARAQRQLPPAVCAELWKRMVTSWGHLADLMELHDPAEFVAGDLYAGLELLYLNNTKAEFAAGGGSLYGQLLAGLPEPGDAPPMLSVCVVPPADAVDRAKLDEQLATLTLGHLHIVKRGDYLRLSAELHLRVEDLFRHRQRALALWTVMLQRTLAGLNSLPAIQPSRNGYLKQVAPGSDLMQPITAAEKAAHDDRAALFIYLADMLSKELVTMHRAWLRASRCEVPDLPRGPLLSLANYTPPLEIPGCIHDNPAVVPRAGLPGQSVCEALDAMGGLWLQGKPRAMGGMAFVRFRYVGAVVTVEVGDSEPVEITDETRPIYQGSEYKAIAPTFIAAGEYRVVPWDKLEPVDARAKLGYRRGLQLDLLGVHAKWVEHAESGTEKRWIFTAGLSSFFYRPEEGWSPEQPQNPAVQLIAWETAWLKPDGATWEEVEAKAGVQRFTAAEISSFAIADAAAGAPLPVSRDGRTAFDVKVTGMDKVAAAADEAAVAVENVDTALAAVVVEVAPPEGEAR